MLGGGRGPWERTMERGLIRWNGIQQKGVLYEISKRLKVYVLDLRSATFSIRKGRAL